MGLAITQHLESCIRNRNNPDSEITFRHISQSNKGATEKRSKYLSHNKDNYFQRELCTFCLQLQPSPKERSAGFGQNPEWGSEWALQPNPPAEYEQLKSDQDFSPFQTPGEFWGVSTVHLSHKSISIWVSRAKNVMYSCCHPSEHFQRRDVEKCLRLKWYKKQYF